MLGVDSILEVRNGKSSLDKKSGGKAVHLCFVEVSLHILWWGTAGRHVGNRDPPRVSFEREALAHKPHCYRDYGKHLQGGNDL